MGLVMLLEFLNLGSGEGQPELGHECLRTVPCVLLSYGLATAGSVEMLEVPVSTTVHVCKALHQDCLLLQGFIPQGSDGRVAHKMFLQL